MADASLTCGRQLRGWAAKFESIKPVVGDRPIWITETGLATVDLTTGEPARHDEQAQRLEDVAHDITLRRSRGSAPDTDGRTYWYSLIDLNPQREAIEGFHVDENEYHMGLFTFDGRAKPALRRFREVLRSQTGHREL